MPYKGDGSKYTFTTTNERDRKWEEDIVCFADTFLDYLQGHPKLTERECNVLYYNSLRHADGGYESLYDPELREEFIRRINLLITSIGNKNDSELLFGCSEIIALLNDTHSNIALPFEEVFPLGLIPIYSGEIPEAYIFAAPKANEDMLLCRLDAINGFSVSEIMDKASKLIPHENMTLVHYSLFNDSFSKFIPCRLLDCHLLRYIGVLGEEKIAVFSLTDESGAKREATLSSIVKGAVPEMTVYRSAEAADECMAIDLVCSNYEVSDWYRILDGGKVLYIRMNTCADNSDVIFSEAISSAAESGTRGTVIIDLRGNPGGSNGAIERIVAAVNSLDTVVSKYVLINGGTASAAVSIAVALKHYCDDAVLVGEPAGEPPNGIFQTSSFIFPNHKIQGHISIHKCIYLWPEYTEPTLMPDVVIRQTMDDYKNGIDSVLKYVLSNSAQ